jgi:c-di-GMP-binding flagellar brake protein YcgR
MEQDPALSGQAPHDRRRHHRVDVRLPVTPLLGNVLTGMEGFSTVTLDLSEGGAKIRVPEELLLGEALDLVLHFPDGTAQTCTARVRRSSPFPDEAGESGAWAAVEFTELPEEARAAIVELIAQGRAE